MNFVALGILAGLLAAPCAMAAVSTSDITGAAGAIVPGMDAAPVWYVGDDGSFWQETNSYPGLQTGPVVDEEGQQLAPADTELVGLSMFALPDPTAFTAPLTGSLDSLQNPVPDTGPFMGVIEAFGQLLAAPDIPAPALPDL